MEKMERDLAKLEGFDIGIEDHGLLTMYGTFHYDSGGAQGLGYCIDASFLYRFLAVFGVGRLQEVNGMSCWVTHNNWKITKIEPLHKNDGAVFDLEEWSEYIQKLNLPSPHEMRTGDPD